VRLNWTELNWLCPLPQATNSGGGFPPRPRTRGGGNFVCVFPGPCLCLHHIVTVMRPHTRPPSHNHTLPFPSIALHSRLLKWFVTTQTLCQYHGPHLFLFLIIRRNRKRKFTTLQSAATGDDLPPYGAAPLPTMLRVCLVEYTTACTRRLLRLNTCTAEVQTDDLWCIPLCKLAFESQLLKVDMIFCWSDPWQKKL